MPRNASQRFSRTALAALTLGAVAPVLSGPAAAQQRSTYEELQMFSGVLNHVRLNYADQVGYHELVAAAIRGMLNSLDPHSYFVSRGDWTKRGALERGELAITGMALDHAEGALTVLSVLPRSPAAKAGILPGDRLLSVNDTTVAGLDLSALELQLAGEKGSRVRLRLERGPRLEPDTFSVTVKRDFVESRSVSVARMVDSITAYIRLEEFGGKAPEELSDALKALRGRRARQLILDLRGNPGGSVIAAVELASEFLPRNTVVFRTRGRKRDVDTTFVTKRDGGFRGVPMIVLIDEGSASASEALAGSLQDHDRALLMGRRSFGKALMQAPFFLESGDMVWLTVGRVVTPSGRFIQRRYRGLAAAQYRELAGRGGAGEDTALIYHTDGGRPVHGGGGIAPDVEIPAPPSLPVWFSVAADSGYDTAVADSVALTLNQSAAARAAWMDDAAAWQSRLAAPFLGRVRARLHVTAQPDSAVVARIGRILASRVAEVRWGADAREEFLVRNSTDVRVAVTYFPRLTELLAPVQR